MDVVYSAKSPKNIVNKVTLHTTLVTQNVCACACGVGYKERGRMDELKLSHQELKEKTKCAQSRHHNAQDQSREGSAVPRGKRHEGRDERTNKNRITLRRVTKTRPASSVFCRAKQQLRIKSMGAGGVWGVGSGGECEGGAPGIRNCRQM